MMGENVPGTGEVARFPVETLGTHKAYMMGGCETVPGTGEVARFPAETLGTHKDGNTEHNVTSTGSPTATPGNESLTKQPDSTIEGVQTKAASPAAPSSLVVLPASSTTVAVDVLGCLS
jgi:hypothetical protein